MNAQDFVMADPVLIATHSLAILVGYGLRDWLPGSNQKSDCPSCIVTCGSLSCPHISCSTGHIELGPYTTLLLTAVVVIGLLGLWWILAAGVNQRVTTGPVSKDLVDGRRIGTAIGWRPDGRQ